MIYFYFIHYFKLLIIIFHILKILKSIHHI
nr:MAG TPA: hypothetical protein [Caudoviricetes sp.]